MSALANALATGQVYWPSPSEKTDAAKICFCPCKPTRFRSYANKSRVKRAQLAGCCCTCSKVANLYSLPSTCAPQPILISVSENSSGNLNPCFYYTFQSISNISLILIFTPDTLNRVVDPLGLSTIVNGATDYSIDTSKTLFINPIPGTYTVLPGTTIEIRTSGPILYIFFGSNPPIVINSPGNILNVPNDVISFRVSYTPF